MILFLHVTKNNPHDEKKLFYMRNCIKIIILARLLLEAYLMIYIKLLWTEMFRLKSSSDLYAPFNFMIMVK